MILDVFNENLSFIVRMEKTALIYFLQERLEKGKAWSTEMFRAIVTTTPTMPLPKNLTGPLDMPIVKMNPNTREVKWTNDNWATWEARQLTGAAASKTWTSYASPEPTDEDTIVVQDDDNEVIGCCPEGAVDEAVEDDDGVPFVGAS